MVYYRTTPTNKALFGPECGLCKVVELRTKGKYLVTVTTTTDAAAKVKESAKAKAKYQEIYFNIAEIDVISSEFKLLKECRKMLTKPHTDTTHGDPIDKLVSHINSHATADSLLNYCSCPFNQQTKMTVY